MVIDEHKYGKNENPHCLYSKLDRIINNNLGDIIVNLNLVMICSTLYMNIIVQHVILKKHFQTNSRNQTFSPESGERSRINVSCVLVSRGNDSLDFVRTISLYEKD